MNLKRVFIILITILLLSACRQNEIETPAAGAGEISETTPEVILTDPVAATSSAAKPATEATTASPSNSNEESAAKEPQTQPPSAEGSLSSLLGQAWDDRSLFAAGLLENEQGVLNELPGASIYHIVLDIDEPDTVHGQMELRYTNQENMALESLFFHLFPGQLGGKIEIFDVLVNGQPAQTTDQDTTLEVALDKVLEPGEQAIIQMNFETTIPEGDTDTGKYNILVSDQGITTLAHFYPMVAVFDQEGWHTEPSPPHGDETYADSSFYVVQVRAPSEQVLVSSGVEVAHEEMDGSQLVTIAAGPMRDFYLAMSDRYQVISDNIGGVTINSYAPVGFSDGAELALDTAVEAFQSYNSRYGPYPFSELDIVSTPTTAFGVEYPGVFANALRLYDLTEYSSGLPNPILLESTTAHETAHQWFYSLVGNDQLNEPWLDEGLTQYATWMYYIDRYGQGNAQGFYNSLEDRWGRVEFAEIPIDLPASAYTSQEYGAIVYGRAPIFLKTLAETMGQDRFDAFMHDYFAQYRYLIATTEGFFNLAEKDCNCDLEPLFAEWVWDN